MAHGKRKWIVRHDGRIKRSRHRTRMDWMGELAAGAAHARWQACRCWRCSPYPRTLCADCALYERVHWPKGRRRSFTPPAAHRRGIVQKYRAQMKQLMRNGRYDDLWGPVRNLWYDYY